MVKVKLNPNLEQKIVYESPMLKITSLDQAEKEASFLQKAYSLGMFNKMIWLVENQCNGYIGSIENNNELDRQLNRLTDTAKKGNLPIEYSVGMNINSE